MSACRAAQAILHEIRAAIGTNALILDVGVDPAEGAGVLLVGALELPVHLVLLALELALLLFQLTITTLIVLRLGIDGRLPQLHAVLRRRLMEGLAAASAYLGGLDDVTQCL